MLKHVERTMRLWKRSARVAFIGALLALLPPGSAWALEERDARRHVMAVAGEIVALTANNQTEARRRDVIKAIFEDKVALRRIARFTLGRAARQASAAQIGAFEAAFSDFLASNYARRFQDYAGEAIVLDGSKDAGRKGILVITRVVGGERLQKPVRVEWLVSDRGGRVEIVDLIIEGISLVITQREEIAAMLDAHGGDIDRLIVDLRNRTTAQSP